MPNSVTPSVLIAVSEEGDWEGIYVNGELKAEGHSLDARQIIEALGLNLDRRSVSTEWFEKTGSSSLPQSAADLPGDDTC